MARAEKVAEKGARGHSPHRPAVVGCMRLDGTLAAHSRRV